MVFCPTLVLSNKPYYRLYSDKVEPLALLSTQIPDNWKGVIKDARNTKYKSHKK